MKSPGDRLQKVLAHAGVASRRRIEEMIRDGRITVNGRDAVLGQRVDLARDAVKVDGKRIQAGSGERRYLLLNKPTGYVSTREDPEGRPTVLDLLPPRMRKGLMSVGRLDYESEGLLIVTDDGDFAQHVAHPRYGCVKTYDVKVKGRPEAAAIQRLRNGIVLYGKRTAPVSIASRPAPSGPRESVSNSWWTVRLGEGRTRQIREMFFRIGHPVSRLRRAAIGALADPQLPRGAWRELTEKEVEQLRRRTAEPAPRPARKPKRAGAKPGKAETSSTQPDGGSKRGAPKRGGPNRGGPKRGAPKRGGPKRGAPKRGGPNRDSPQRGGAKPARGPAAKGRATGAKSGRPTAGRSDSGPAAKPGGRKSPGRPGRSRTDRSSPGKPSRGGPGGRGRRGGR
ncbi:MAG: pseudouridine synthase [Acidobacteriota bacterium]